MKILFSVGNIEKKGNANTKIAINIAHQLAKKGHLCEVIGLCNDSPPFIIEEDNLTIRGLAPFLPVLNASCAFNIFLSTSGLKYPDAKKAFVLKHPFKSIWMMIKYLPIYQNFIETSIYKKHFLRCIKDLAPDNIIAFYKPINLFQALFDVKCSIPIFIYQLDPWGLHLEISDSARDLEISKESIIFDKACHIFTTPVLLKEYLAHTSYVRFIDKLTAFDFPNIIDPSPFNTASPINFDKNDINILFCGIISDDYRNPCDFLPLFKQIFLTNNNVKVYFLGTSTSDVLYEYIKKYPLNIFAVDAVSADKAFAAMENADILLNISNTLINQVPSKIFDYFSIGKPILNIQKIPSCPGAEYFNRYPLALTLKTFSTINFTEFKDFILTAKGKQLAFDTIQEIFYTATPEYVANTLETILKREVPLL